MFTRFILLHRAILIGIIGMAWASFASLPAMAAPESWSLFGTQEKQFEDLQTFKKWLQVRERIPGDESTQSALCKASPKSPRCVLTPWLNLLQGMRGLPPLEQIKRVNTAMNTIAYTEDMVNWGMQDYWETPIEFLAHTGDCEDYSIAKYKSLRMLGFPPEAMRIVVLNDMNLSALHAVLAVRTNGTTYILDNQIADIAEDRRILHYEPIYSINEQHWWRHLPKTRR